MTPNRFSLDGRAALVTGASRGIGAAIAGALAEAGADVALCARGNLDEVADTVRAVGSRAVPITCDVTDADQVAAGVSRAWDELSGIDVLVNNAGGPLFHAAITDVREDGWQRVLDLNLTSVLRLCQQCGTRMVARGSGSIINIASVLPTRSWPAVAAYSAAKAGVLNLTSSLATAFGPDGVRANAICPGWVRTDTNWDYLADAVTATTAVDAVPMGRWADPADVAGTAVWLASDAAAYVTGAVIPVDGGLSVGVSRTWQQAMQPPRHTYDRIGDRP